MRVVLLSDAHLGGPDDPNQVRLLAFLEALECDRLCLLGDIFQHWWHFGREPFAAYAPVVAALRRFPLTFVPGNHDFLAAEWFRDELGAEVGAEISTCWDGLRVHLSHGDAADTSRGYRTASAVLRGRPFRTLVDTLGPKRGWGLLARIAGKPHGVPDARLLLAQERIAAGLLATHDLVVMGHTHAPSCERLGAGTYVNLGDWVRWHTWLLVEDGVVTLLRRTPEGDRPLGGSLVSTEASAGR